MCTSWKGELTIRSWELRVKSDQKISFYNLYNCFAGKADKNLCESILNELRQAVVKTTADPIRSAKQNLFFTSKIHKDGH